MESGYDRAGTTTNRKRTGTKIIDTVSPDDLLTGYDLGLFFRVSLSWHGSEIGQNQHVLARVKHSRAVIEHDHCTSIFGVPAIAATATTTSVERERIDEPTITASTPSFVEIDREYWNDRERIEMAFERGLDVEESDFRTRPQVFDRPRETRGYSAKAPPSIIYTSSRPSLTNIYSVLFVVS
jgi:hypothetical protein